MSSVVKVDFEGDRELIATLRKLGVDVERLLVRAAEAGAELIRADANQNAPSPNVEMETTSPRKGQVEVAIGPDKAHWHHRFAELGASEHAITAKNAGALAFEGSEGEVVRTAVTHPGVAKRPFLRPAIDEQKEPAAAQVGRVVKGALP